MLRNETQQEFKTQMSKDSEIPAVFENLSVALEELFSAKHPDAPRLPTYIINYFCQNPTFSADSLSNKILSLISRYRIDKHPQFEASVSPTTVQVLKKGSLIKNRATVTTQKKADGVISSSSRLVPISESRIHFSVRMKPFSNSVTPSGRKLPAKDKPATVVLRKKPGHPRASPSNQISSPAKSSGPTKKSLFSDYFQERSNAPRVNA